MRIPLKLRWARLSGRVARWFDDASVTVYDCSETLGASILSPIWGLLLGVSKLGQFPRIRMDMLSNTEKSMAVYCLKYKCWPKNDEELEQGQKLIDTNAEL